MAGMADQPKTRTKFVVTFTPNNHPVKFDFGEQTDSGRLVKILQQRLKDSNRATLTKQADEDFLKGVAAFFGLRYGADLLKLVQNSVSVDMTVDEVPDL